MAKPHIISIVNDMGRNIIYYIVFDPNAEIIKPKIIDSLAQ
jgi:hypothetical protein